MTVGFDTGSKWFDNYFEAYYEVIECYYKSLDRTLSTQYFDYSEYYKDNILPAAKQTAATLKGLYSSKYFNDYYKDFYKNYFFENSWETIWAAYGYGDCNVSQIIKKWGFSSKNKPNRDKSNGSKSDDPIISASKKYNAKLAEKIKNFNSDKDSLEIDTDSFGIKKNATFASGKNLKIVKKKLASQDFDFIYDQNKGGLYFNENESDKGFGDGGIIAILRGGPDLSAENVVFI